MIAIIALAAKAVAANVPVEAPTGSRLNVPAPAYTLQTKRLPATDRARATMSEWAVCAVARHRRAVDVVLDVSTDDATLTRAMHTVVDNECLRDSTLKIPGALVRGALYAALYKVDYGTTASTIGAEPIELHNGIPRYPDQDLAMLPFADCVVREDPHHSRDIVLAPGASSTERDGFAGLAPHMSNCLRNGDTLTLTKVALTGAIADALYREAHNHASPTNARN